MGFNCGGSRRCYRMLDVNKSNRWGQRSRPPHRRAGSLPTASFRGPPLLESAGYRISCIPFHLPADPHSPTVGRIPFSEENRSDASHTRELEADFESTLFLIKTLVNNTRYEWCVGILIITTVKTKSRFEPGPSNFPPIASSYWQINNE